MSSCSWSSEKLVSVAGKYTGIPLVSKLLVCTNDIPTIDSWGGCPPSKIKYTFNIYKYNVEEKEGRELCFKCLLSANCVSDEGFHMEYSPYDS